jgi:hypothetical protein
MKFGKGAREMRALFHFKIRNYVAPIFGDGPACNVGLRRESPVCLLIKRLPNEFCGEWPRAN